MTAITRLQRVIDQLHAAGGDFAWLAGGFCACASKSDTRLDAALGLPPTWRRDFRNARRDGLLRQLAADLPGSTRARAAALQAEVRDYAGNGWPREKHLPTLPASASSQRRILHEVFKLDAEPPTSLRRLIDIIDVCSNDPMVTAHKAGDTASHGR